MTEAPPPRTGTPVHGAEGRPLLPLARPLRLHIMGASGSGTTTLAREIAARWSVPCMDTDDFYWVPTDPAYTVKRSVPMRLALMEQMFLPRMAWVLSGSLVGWGNPVMDHVDMVILLRLDPDERMARLEAREVLRSGPAIQPGGPQYRAYRSFMDWAAGYDDPTFTGRSRAQHLHWLDGMDVPWVELDSALSVEDLARRVTG